jgi:hypothetical protein
MRLACISIKAKGHPAYWRRWHWRQRTGYCNSNNRSKSLMRKRDRRKLEEEHSGQVTGIHRLPLQEAIIYPARAESYFSTVARLSRRSAGFHSRRAGNFSGCSRQEKALGGLLTDEVNMVWDVSFTCDICGRKKLEANHWWMLVLGDVPCFDEGQPRQRFTLMPWNKAESGNPDFYHLCGQGCAMQAMERFMNHGSIVSDSLLHSATEAAAGNQSH